MTVTSFASGGPLTGRRGFAENDAKKFKAALGANAEQSAPALNPNVPGFNQRMAQAVALQKARAAQIARLTKKVAEMNRSRSG